MAGIPLVAVADWFDDDLMERLAAVARVRSTGGGASVDEIVAATASADGLLVGGHGTSVDSEFLAASPRLRVISTASVGYDHIDVRAATDRSILVCHTPGVLNDAMVDLTMVMIISLARQLFQNERYVRGGRWAAGEPTPPFGMEIRGKTLGVVGYGRIGRDVARRMRSLGMNILWCGNGTGPDTEEHRSLEEVLEASDFVSVHATVPPDAPPLIGRRELVLMKESAYLINTARGYVVDQDALTEALQTGAVAGAALDVLTLEPPLAGDPIVRLPNVVAFPHVGTATNETRRAMRELAVDNLITGLSGTIPRAVVNPHVLASLRSACPSSAIEASEDTAK